MSDNLNGFRTATDTLADGESLTVALSIGNSTHVSTVIDAGDGKTAPATHDLAWQQRPIKSDSSADNDAWITTATESGTTRRWWLQERPAPDYWRATVTNRSGGEATFRVRLLGHGGDE